MRSLQQAAVDWNVTKTKKKINREGGGDWENVDFF
jgi:hypothetical protein